MVGFIGGVMCLRAAHAEYGIWWIIFPRESTGSARPIDKWVCAPIELCVLLIRKPKKEFKNSFQDGVDDVYFIFPGFPPFYIV